MTAAKNAKLKVVKSLYLKAPPHHVWKYLTTASGLTKWFHDAPHDLEEAGEWRLDSNSLGREGEKILWGRVIEMKRHEKLVHTFTNKFLDGVETTCTWTLEPVENGTLLTLTHDGFPDFTMAVQHDTGWDMHFGRLRLVVA
jgi:uncharacterized protein YndB with AHSA1/START domain